MVPPETNWGQRACSREFSFALKKIFPETQTHMSSTLDSWVKRNARKVFITKQSAEAAKGRKYTHRDLARDMTPWLFPEEDPTFARVDSVYKTLCAYLGEGGHSQPWRLDYLEAFGLALAVAPSDLCSPDFRPGEQTDPEHVRLLMAALELHASADRESKGRMHRMLGYLGRVGTNRPLLRFVADLIGHAVAPETKDVRGEIIKYVQGADVPPAPRKTGRATSSPQRHRKVF